MSRGIKDNTFYNYVPLVIGAGSFLPVICSLFEVSDHLMIILFNASPSDIHNFAADLMMSSMVAFVDLHS